MAGTIHRNADARNDLSELVGYFAAIRFELAISFLDAVKGTLDGLLEFPGKGRLVSLRSKRYPDLRLYTVNRFTNYVIYYRSVSDGIEVVRVLHGARDRDSIFGTE